MILRGTFILLLLCFSIVASAQDSVIVKNTPMLSVAAYGGKVFAHHDIMKPLVNEVYTGQELSIAFQTNGSKYYQQLYNYPLYGFGLYAGQYHKKQLGCPFAVF